jgi:hypothetical protein
MQFLAQLWLPILASAVLVFVMSSLIHMVFKWHNPEYLKFANEDDVRSAMRAAHAAPGLYVVPHCLDMKVMQSPEFQQKYVEGPVAFVTVRPNGPPNMGAPLVQWFVFSVAVSVAGAYLASRTLPATATFGQVLRVVGTTSFLAYAGGSFISGIWMGHPWKAVTKEVFDGLLYAALTGATFAWLWPR